MSNSQGLYGKMRENWGIIVSLVALFAWIITQIIVATQEISTMQHVLQDTQKGVDMGRQQFEAHTGSETGHYKLSARLIKVETEVNHINTTQKTNFKDIKEQLKTIQVDVKEIRGR